MNAVDVIVAGAGPAGSATGALLAAAGLRVLMVERAAFPRAKPCAEYLSPEAGRILERLGVLDEVARGAARLRGMRIVGPSGHAFTGRYRAVGTSAPFTPWGLALPRERLDATLAARAVRAGAALRERTVLESFSASAAGVRAHVRSAAGRETVQAALLIGADGLHSRVARTLGVGRRTGLARTAFVTHMAGVAEMTDVGEMHVARDAYVGLADVGAGITNVAAVVNRRALPRAHGADRQLEAVLSRFPRLGRRCSTASRVGPVMAVGPFGWSTTRATGDGVALVGDAADFYDPFTGEGIFSALRGAELLVPHALQALDAGGPHARALARYDRDRRATFRDKWRLERAIGAVVGRPSLLDHVVRRLARHQDVADLLIGATGDFIPARRVLRASIAWRLVA
jgi:flavin-dependent dehydrogenase